MSRIPFGPDWSRPASIGIFKGWFRRDQPRVTLCRQARTQIPDRHEYVVGICSRGLDQ